MNPDPAAASNNLHHTSNYMSEEDEYWEWKRDRAEANYFATHDDPQLPTAILVGNGSIDWSQPNPF